MIFYTHLGAPHISQDHISEYKSFVQKSFCFDQIKIDTQEEIMLKLWMPS